MVIAVQLEPKHIELFIMTFFNFINVALKRFTCNVMIKKTFYYKSKPAALEVEPQPTDMYITNPYPSHVFWVSTFGTHDYGNMVFLSFMEYL